MLSAPRPYLIRHQERRTGCTYERGVRAGRDAARNPQPRNSRAGERRGRTYPYNMRQHPEPKPRDDRDAAKDIARDLAEIASHIGQLKGDTNAYLSDPKTTTDSSSGWSTLSLRWRLPR